MAAEMGLTVLMADLDPQANLTAVGLSEDQVERLGRDRPETIFSGIAPLLEGVGDIAEVRTQTITHGLSLLAGDLRLSTAEQEFAQQWPASLDNNARSFRVLSAISRVIAGTAHRDDADVVLVDVGPSLGAINRVAMVASDHVVVPVSPDLYSVQGLRNLGPMLSKWREEWSMRLAHYSHDFDLPRGQMNPLGYIVLQHGTQNNRPVAAYNRWISAMPNEYRRSVLDSDESFDGQTRDDPHNLGLVKNYNSLILMAQEARRPIFKLRSGDGAIGAHQETVQSAYQFFKELTRSTLDRVDVALP